MLGSRRRPGTSAEIGELTQGNIDLERGALVADALYGGEKLRRQIARLEEPHEGHPRVRVARHDGGREFGSPGEGHPGDPALRHPDTGHFRAAANLYAQAPGGRGQGLRQPSHAASHVAPHAALSVRLAHDVVEQHVRRAGHGRARHGPDDGVRGERGLQLLGLEPAIENGARRSREDFHRLRGRPPQALEPTSEREERDRAGCGAW